MLYSLNEIFYSIQGEGHHTGSPAVFIRLAGCNLKCPWCDTDHSEKMVMTSGDIIKRITAELLTKGYNDSVTNIMIVLTGGEPSLQDLAPLCGRLKHYGFKLIAIETNGTNMPALRELKLSGLLDWITVSPKTGVRYEPDQLIITDEIKIVYDPSINPEDFVFLKKYQRKLYIQPCSENFEPAVNYVLKHPHWKLSVQTQKVINVK